MRLSLKTRLMFVAALAGSLAAPVAVRAQDLNIPVMTLRAALQLPPDQLPKVFISPNPYQSLPLQRSPDRRPQPQSRRLHEVGLHRPQVTGRLSRGATRSPSKRGRSLRSELDAQARCWGDVLGRQEAVREAAIDVREHHAGVEVDALDRPIIDHSGNGVLRAGASAVVDADNVENIPVGWTKLVLA